MTFYDMLEQMIGLLQRHGWVTYRALQRQYGWRGVAETPQG
jgi:hypothetical protein